jgi:LPXTG-site transpeptidase (sortase) family protein
VDELLQANPNLNPQLLRVGQEVKIPTKKSGEVTPAATQPPTPTATPTPQGPVTYVIQGGDTFLSLAIKHKLTVEDLLEANPGIDPRRMQVGQAVKIPQPGGTTGTTVAEVVATPAANTTKGTAPTRITASSIGLDAQVVEIGSHKETQQGTEVTVWEEADSAAGLHRGSAYPGQVGNIVISARHNSQGEVFRHIAELKEGAEIQLYAGDKVYGYIVEQILIIPDKYISAEKRRENEAWIGSTSDERLTLVSFWPYETNTHRVIVIAKPAAAITPQTTPAVQG